MRVVHLRREVLEFLLQEVRADFVRSLAEQVGGDANAEEATTGKARKPFLDKKRFRGLPCLNPREVVTTRDSVKSSVQLS